MMIVGARFCPHCGAASARSEMADEPSGLCPRCGVLLARVRIGATHLEECGRCHGLWVDAESFKKICQDREAPAASPGQDGPKRAGKTRLEQVKYVRCPACRQLMHRVNFANCSGVIVDVCKKHGTWFDQDELMRIVEFLRGGGMEQAHEKRAVEMAERERRLRALQQQRASEDRKYDVQTNRALIPEVILFAGDLRKLFKPSQP
jgi:Zn-finger nucleic acid-binding protein